MIKIKKYQIEDYISDATQDALDLKADLVDGKVPASQLPSFVDDVIEVANYAALPIPGASGVIYITLDTNKVYRWTGSVYVEIASGVTNLSYTPGVSNGTVNSDTGSDATIPLAGTVNAGLFSAAEKSKLEGIAPNANVGVIPNAPITGATKTKITYDTKGLVTVGEDATTADIADSTNKRYVTDANLTVINNTSGTNTGNQGLQSVTDIGATTTNGITITVGDGEGDGVSSFSSQGYGIKGESNETYGVYGTSSASAGVYGIGAIGVYGASINGNGVEGTSVDGNAIYGSSGNVVGVYARSDYGTGLYGYTEDGVAISVQSNAIGLEVNGNGTIAIEANLGNSNKGLVINSGTSSTGNFIELDKNGVDKLTINQEGEFSVVKIPGGLSTEYLMADGTTTTGGGSQNLQQVTDIGASTTNAITALSFIKDGGFDFQFLKADGSVDNNTYLTSADLPSTLDLYATTSPDPVIAGYTALVRNIADSRYNTVAVDVPTPVVDGTELAPTFCGAVISDPSILLGNPGVFNFTVVGNIRRVGGSTSSGADFFYTIYKRDLAGTETFISNGAKVPVPANGGLYIEYISTALWNDGIFLSTDRVVLKFYGIQTGGGTGATYEFLFGGADPVRGTAAISSAIIPNLYLRDLADVEKTPALNNEILYWNDPASLWEHSAVIDLIPDASATQKGLVTTGTQTFAGFKTFTGAVNISNSLFVSTNTDIAINAVSQDSDAISAESNNGNGIVGVSTNLAGGVFMTTNGANIAEFKTNFVLKAAIQNDGKITATAGTASTDVVVKSQLDTKQNTITLSAIGSSPNANAATLTGSVLNLQPASASFGGVVTTGTQSFAGSKTLLDGIRFGSTGSFNFYEFSSAPYFSGGVGGTLTIGGGPGNVQNNLAVPNGTLNIGLQTASTIASFDANRNVVSLTTANGYPTLAELKWLAGTTSSIQTQLNYDASATQRGAVTTGTQTFAGAKTILNDNAGLAALSVENNTGKGIYAYGGNGVAAQFIADGGTDIVTFENGGVVSKIQSDGKITATAGTASTDVVVKSQLDTKQNTITLTTTGTSGAATLIGSTLNIPQYSGGGSSAQTGTIILTSGASTILPAAITTSTIFRIELIGGGGGGAGGASTNQHGSGGGGGGYIYKELTGFTGGGTLNYTIGAGGNGGASANNGTAGTSTTLNAFGAVYTASGGGAGLAAISSAGGAGGTGTATGGTPDIAITGQAGDGTPSGQSLVTPSARGGDAPRGWGSGGSSVIQSRNGNAGTGFGSGGSSGKLATFTGGAGAQGIISITWFN